MRTYTPEETLAWALEEIQQLAKRAERQYNDVMNTTSRYYGEDHYIMKAITADVEKCEDTVHDMLKIANEIKMRTRGVDIRGSRLGRPVATAPRRGAEETGWGCVLASVERMVRASR